MKTRYLLGVFFVFYLVAIGFAFSDHALRANLLGLVVVIAMMPTVIYGARHHSDRYPDNRSTTMRWAWAMEIWLVIAALSHAIGIAILPSESSAAYAIVPLFILLLVVFLRLNYYETTS